MPVWTVSAPGNPLNRWSKLRFSCMMMTMCWIGPEDGDTGPPVTGAVLTGEVLTGEVLTGEVLTGAALAVGATPEPHPAEKSDSSRKILLPRRESIRPPSE